MTRLLWRSATGYFALHDGTGQGLLEVAGRVQPVALSLREIEELRAALALLLPIPALRPRPGPTEYKTDESDSVPPPAPRRRAREAPEHDDGA